MLADKLASIDLIFGCIARCTVGAWELIRTGEGEVEDVVVMVREETARPQNSSAQG